MKVIDYNLIYSDYIVSDCNESLIELLEKYLKKANITKVTIPGNSYYPREFL